MGARQSHAPHRHEEKVNKRTESVPKAFRINYSDLVAHGFTDGCPQCEHNSRTTRSKGGISHTEACRKRMLDALMSTPEGRVRLEAYEERVDRAIADRIEAAEPVDDQQPRPQPAEPPAARVPAFAEASVGVGNGPISREARSDFDPADLRDENHEEGVAEVDGGDADMGAVQEEESEEEMGIVHGDIDDEVSAILLAQVGHSSRSYRRELRKGYKHLVSEI